MIKAVIFDLDGTLLNTLGDIYKVLNQSLEKFNLPKVTYEDAKNFIGNGAKKLVERAVGNRFDLAQEVYEYYAEIFAKCKNDATELFEGEEQALSALVNAGVKLALITNKPQNATSAVYTKFLAEFKFSEVLGQTEYYPLKPNPTSTFEVLKRLGVKKQECVFVGDGETDVQTAKAAGLRCISVLWGYRTREQLEVAGASEFCENFSELADMILD
ncbi:MAG: HAD-IA family hydrolase [Clostridia bacterium]|nr:HAD-IA family hydrolase [Clostridia bacterium]